MVIDHIAGIDLIEDKMYHRSLTRASYSQKEAVKSNGSTFVNQCNGTEASPIVPHYKRLHIIMSIHRIRGRLGLGFG